MTVAEPAERPGRAAMSERGCAFGIGVAAPIQLMAGTGGARAGDREVVLELGSSAELDDAWGSGRSERVLERVRRDGRLVMAVDHQPDLGYRVYAPCNGRHLVSPDGARIFSARPIHALWRWQRLLFAQVLPLAATLQGLELLHASAAEWNGRTFGLVARAGTGKTSVAAHVVARGGVLVTDDVLALEERSGVVMAHPGAASLSIDSAELVRMPPNGRPRLGSQVGRADKVVLAAELATVRRPSDTSTSSSGRRRDGCASRRSTPDPVRLLANSFNTYVRTPERIVNQLAVVDRLARTVPAFSVRIPSGEDASSVARGGHRTHGEGMTDRPVATGFRHIELIKPIRLRTKAALVVEIVITYARVRWLLWRHDLPHCRCDAPRERPAHDRPAPPGDRRSARTWHRADAALRPLRFALSRTLTRAARHARAPGHRLDSRHRGRRRARILRARVGRERWPRAPSPPRRELPADRAMTEATRSHVLASTEIRNPAGLTPLEIACATMLGTDDRQSSPGRAPGRFPGRNGQRHPRAGAGNRSLSRFVLGRQGVCLAARGGHGRGAEPGPRRPHPRDTALRGNVVGERRPTPGAHRLAPRSR